MTTASVPARGALPIGQLACRVLATVAPEDSLRDVLAVLLGPGNELAGDVRSDEL